MRRVGSIVAAVSLSFPLEDARPESGIPLTLVTDALAERYNFRVRPTPVRGLTLTLPATAALATPVAGIAGTSPIIQFAPGAGAPTAVPVATSFRNGAISKSDRTIAIPQLDLSIDSDPGAFVVHAATTNAAEDVLDDIIQTLESQFSFRNITQVATREYLSNVVVTFERPIEERLKELGMIQDIVNAALTAQSGATVGFERITYGVDLTAVPVARLHTVHGFVLERRANHPFSENRYFSSAPLKTDDHFATLEKISAILEK